MEQLAHAERRRRRRQRRGGWRQREGEQRELGVRRLDAVKAMEEAVRVRVRIRGRGRGRVRVRVNPLWRRLTSSQ